MNELIIIILIVFLLVLAVYLYLQNAWLSISKFEMLDKSIPKEFNGFKICQITDFHNTHYKSLRKRIINKLKEENPDIIVITGDLIDNGKKRCVNMSANFIKEIKDIAPIYFVAGNHEQESGKSYNDLRKKLEENNVTILDNKVKELNINGSIINLVGLKDPTFDKSKLDNDVKADNQLSKIDYNKKNYSILLSHRPELIDVYAKHKFNLVLVGHAHGGQMRIPFVGGVIAPQQGFFPKYDYGEYKEKNTTMIVSRGIGNSGFPFRVNNRPDLVFVTLQNNK